MRIERRVQSPERDHQLVAEIAEAAHSRGIDGRICSENCAVKCSRCGSLSCQCECSPDCPDAAATLSVDPEHYPIEPEILPLVFQMKRLGLFQPCWSCEGHLAPNGALWKLPSVWFYCSSATHLRLLAMGLDRLAHAKKLHTAWQITVTYSDPDNPETTFSLQPACSADNPPSLSHLREDVAEIARSLQYMMNDEGRKLQREIGPGRGNSV